MFCFLFFKNIFKILKRGGYFSGIKEFFGFFPKIEGRHKKRLWIQAVSVGELNAITPLVKKLGEHFDIILTTTTSTGKSIIAKNLSSDVIFYGFFPLDFVFFQKRAYKTFHPDVVLMVESELWPEHIEQASKKGLPIFLINARLSDRSFRRYKKFPRFARWILGKIDYILASSQENCCRIQHFVDQKVECLGNLKFDCEAKFLEFSEKTKLKQSLGFKQDSFVMIGCSTWPGEEDVLIDTFQYLRKIFPQKDVRLLLVPRHAERGKELAEILRQRSGLKYIQRSQVKDFRTIGDNVLVHLADTTGELKELIQVADITFVGKSLPPNNGGQSPLDAAMFGVPVIYGPQMTNFKEICESLERRNASIRIKSPEILKNVMERLIANPNERERLSQSLLSWVEENKGATDFTLRFILEKLNGEH